MKLSLSLKIFLAVLLSFLFIIVGIIVTLDLYFNHFYESVKIDQMSIKINELAKDNRQRKWTVEELYRQIGIFSVENNVDVRIAYTENEEGDLEASESHTSENSKMLVIVVDDAKNYYDFFLNDEVFDRFALKAGMSIVVEGYKETDSLLVVSAIDGKAIADESGFTIGQQSVKVRVSLLKVNADPSLVATSSESSGDAYTLLSANKKNGVYYSINQIPHTGVKEVNFTYMSNDDPIVYYVKSSLQPVKDTLVTISSFYPYFFLISFILALLVAFIHSRWISKPIVRLTAVANEMAQLNFEPKLRIESDDEIGQLSLSLNTMSEGLENALNNLHLANNQLKKDVEYKSMQEKLQKDFIANASHELKTPLGVIRGYAEGLKDDINAKRQDEFVDTIIDEVRKMNTLVLEMLKVSKVDNVEYQVNYESLEMFLLLADTFASFEMELAKKKLTIEFNGDFESVTTDRYLMETLVTNLISNAVKYAKDGSLIGVRGINTNGVQGIEIFNTTHPFSKEELSNVWNRFYKRDLSHNSDIQGTGLGLSIVKAIFDKLSMNYGVYNVDKGVVFWFEV